MKYRKCTFCCNFGPLAWYETAAMISGYVRSALRN